MLAIAWLTAFDSKAQNTLIVLNDSTKLKTEITAVADHKLFTQAGSFNLSELYSIRFENNEEYMKKQDLANILRTYPIIVYRGGERLGGLSQQNKSNEAVANTTAYNYTQKSSNEFYNAARTGDFGVGLGLDYGGIGGRLTLLPSKHVGVFFGGGYAFAGFGFNTGLNFRANPDKRVSFIANVMYGYHAAYAVSGASQLNKIFYGFTAGGGVMIRPRREMNSFWTIELLVPFRSKEATNYINVLKSTPGIRVENTLLPVAFSFGYHYCF